MGAFGSSRSINVTLALGYLDFKCNAVEIPKTPAPTMMYDGKCDNDMGLVVQTEASEIQ